MSDETEPTVKISDADIEAKWAQISPLIERMKERIGTPGEFPIGENSSLLGDDTASTPYHVSHAVRMCMTAGVDHLHAVKSLVIDGGLLHIAAPFSLTRGALENFSAAYWILHPTTRNDRIERALRWQAKNFKDGNTAISEFALPNQTPLETKLLKLDAVAQNRGITANIRTGYTSTSALQYVEANSSLKVLFPWRMCSGFAHGRPWAYLNISSTESTATTDPGVVDVQMTSSLGTVLYPALEALHLLQVLLRLYKERANFALDTAP